jgi:hypothetical protein
MGSMAGTFTIPEFTSPYTINSSVLLEKIIWQKKNFPMICDKFTEILLAEINTP